MQYFVLSYFTIIFTVKSNKDGDASKRRLDALNEINPDAQIIIK